MSKAIIKYALAFFVLCLSIGWVHIRSGVPASFAREEPKLKAEAAAAARVTEEAPDHSAVVAESEAPDVPAEVDATHNEQLQIPAGAFRSRLMACAPEIRQKALDQIAALEVPANDLESLRIHPGGKLFYVCDFGGHMPRVNSTPMESDSGDRDTAEASAGSMAVTGPVPVSAPPVWHSRPGATNVLFLDFNGHVVTNTAWNSYPEFATPSWDCRPYSLDGDESTFSVAEQQAMRVIWERVAEDYAPFDIDVTTEQPASWNRYAGHVLITPDVDKNGNPCPHYNAGGIAFIDVFGEPDYSYDYSGECYSPAWVFNYEVNGFAEYEAEAASHEMGHNLELSHDGTKNDAYYGGHENGSIGWGPIMGAPYDRDVTQWSKGEYRLSNNTEDDLAILSTQLGYIPDDHGGDASNAALMSAGATGSVHQTGIIERASDTDVFRFAAAPGAVELAVSPYRDTVSTTWGGNADMLIELRDAGGVLIAGSNPELDTAAAVSTVLTGGVYYLHISVTGVGNPTQPPAPNGYTVYGSLGQYEVSGSIPLDPDVDDDGLPDVWEVAYFGDITNGLAYSDDDDDGADNLSEYIAGFDPTNHASVFRLDMTSLADTNGMLFIVIWESVEGRVYDVLQSSNLTDELFIPAAENLAYPVNSYTDTVHHAESSGFYRVDAKLIPWPE